MNILKTALVIGIGIFVTTTVILLLQNLTLERQLSLTNSTASISSLLNEYQKQFGNISLGYIPPSVSLNGKLFLCECVGGLNYNVEPNSASTIKTNHAYLIQAHLTRKDNVKPSLLYYVCHLEILNSTGKLVAYSWGDMTLLPKHDSSNCGLQWVPTEPDNYTAQAFATEDELGTNPLMFPPPTIHIHVIS